MTLDELEEEILMLLTKENMPLTANEVAKKVNASRYKVLRRLQRLALERKINGRQIKPPRGPWIWWLPRKERKRIVEH